jgi:hypothetical protein
MTAENLAERVRARMPAHRVWLRAEGAPVLSRPAHDAMWDEMRARLRTFAQPARPAGPWEQVRRVVGDAGARLWGSWPVRVVLAVAALVAAVLGLRR